MEPHVYTWGHLFTASYWFSEPLTVHGWLFVVLVALFGGLLIAGLAAIVFGKKWYVGPMKEILRRVGNLAATAGFLGTVWLVFRQEMIPFFAWRFWLLAIVIMIVFWLSSILRYTLVRMPKILAEQSARATQEKYLPYKK